MHTLGFVKRNGLGRIMLVLSWPILISASGAEVVAAKDLPFCERVAKYFEEGLRPDAGLLKTVEWTPVEVRGEGPKKAPVRTSNRR